MKEVRYLLERLGGSTTIGGRLDGSMFGIGDIGIYIRPMPEIKEDGWHLTQVTDSDGTHYVAVHESMFEVLAGGE